VGLSGRFHPDFIGQGQVKSSRVFIWAKKKAVYRLLKSGESPFVLSEFLYAAWIIFIKPALVLYLNSWIFVVFAVLLHPVWYRLVTREGKMMFEKFPSEYPAYAARTGRFFPRTRSH
jgi:protein-S-isoprenylcysteine O-methyltransferase Ste14